MTTRMGRRIRVGIAKVLLTQSATHPTPITTTYDGCGYGDDRVPSISVQKYRDKFAVETLGVFTEFAQHDG